MEILIYAFVYIQNDKTYNTQITISKWKCIQEKKKWKLSREI